MSYLLHLCWVCAIPWLVLGPSFLHKSKILLIRTGTCRKWGLVCWSRMQWNSSKVFILYLSWAAEKAQTGYKPWGSFILPLSMFGQRAQLCNSLDLALLTQGSCINRGYRSGLSARLSLCVASQCGHTFLFLCSNLVTNLCFPTHRSIFKAAGSICWSTVR